MTTKINLPFEADHVGSFLRTEAIKQARAAYKEGKIDNVALREIEDKEIGELVQKQVGVGLKAITDGEFRRSWFMHDFYWGLEGIGYYERDGGVKFKGESTSNDSFEVRGKLRFGDHYMLEDFKYLKSAVDQYGDGTQVAKVSIPSPSQMLYRIVGDKENEIYPSLHDLFSDLAIVYNDAIHAFYNEGCRYVQIDDTVLSALADPEFPDALEKISGLAIDELVELLVQTLCDALKDKPEDMIVAAHLCKGNFKSTHMYEGGYEHVAKLFDRIPFDSYFLEYDDGRSGGFEPLQHIHGNATVVLGLLTSKHGELEDEEQIIERIQEASQSLPLEQLALSPQCGFASTEEGNVLTEDEQWKKMAHVVNIANRVWDKVSTN